jgi:hypothetical protein
MSAAAVLSAARAAGVVVTVEHGNLRARPTPPAEIVAALRQHKAEVVALLSEPEPWVDDPAEWQNWAPVAEPIAWTERPAVIAVVEDLADERWRPGRISRSLGLTRDEVIEILRRTGR